MSSLQIALPCVISSMYDDQMDAHLCALNAVLRFPPEYVAQRKKEVGELPLLDYVPIGDINSSACAVFYSPLIEGGLWEMQQEDVVCAAMTFAQQQYEDERTQQEQRAQSIAQLRSKNPRQVVLARHTLSVEQMKQALQGFRWMSDETLDGFYEQWLAARQRATIAAHVSSTASPSLSRKI